MSGDGGGVVRAFGPGRANLIGEHTDYNGGLSLPFAVAQGVTVQARPADGDEVRVISDDLGEEDRFALAGPERADGWRAYARGAAAELQADGHVLAPVELRISSTVPQGSGLSSSAALTVALCVALLGPSGFADADPIALARACSRVERDWTGADTGLLDQLASLLGRDGHALLIDFATLDVQPVPIDLGAWRLVTVDSGESHDLAASGYNERRAECRAAAERLGVEHLAHADRAQVDQLPEPLRSRARHVLDEDDRVREAVDALRREDLVRVGALLDASHASLRDLYDASTPAVEQAVAALRDHGVAGARMMGGGFGGQVLALCEPGLEPPDGALDVSPSAGARVL